MKIQSSVMAKEEQIAAENRSKLRIIHTQSQVHVRDGKIKNQGQETTTSVAPLTAKEIAYNWLINELKTNHPSHMSERCIFGVISFEVPISECDPNLVEEIMAASNIPLVQKKCWYNLQTGKVIRVHFTYDTPEVGVIHMPV